MKKLVRWFDINMGWFFINGRKQEWWSNYVKEKYFNTKNKKMEDTKKRTLNEIRQVKTYGYTTPKTKVENEYYRKVNFDTQYIVDLIRELPNDGELGKEIRKYYISLTND